MKLPPGLTPAIMKMMMTPLKARPAAMPADTVPFAGCIPTMGYHYAKPGNFPFGPIYGYYNGKATFTEAMIDQKQFAQGKKLGRGVKAAARLQDRSRRHLVRVARPSGLHDSALRYSRVVHSHSAHMAFCGNKSGKRPAFLM